ncbi:LOW QUALITY PROTEIN: receptor-like protein kinase FERONIA [Morus notabilis]|uniref:LOW QUALITY PROTEIN: receptor-like protein kinase FERONIA n=1 Tax=Morus notabilis TaxID=981085 RepID=UPI000CED78F4|nr:LOW QUALITY PROTEIN: receptor-like protein kinase FERONIA [Morus notabilis]
MVSSIKKLLLILALIYFSFYHDAIIITIADSTPVYVPKENIALNCGSQEELTAHDNRIWIADHEKDSRYSLIESDGRNKSNIFEARSQYAVEAVPYMTARVSRSQFTYSFGLTPGPKFIRLHFYPTQYRDLGDFDPTRTFFTVKAGRYTLLKNFSAYLSAESLKQQAFMKEFCVYVGENMEKLDITFLPENHGNSTSYVFVNGIEIVSMPDDLYYTPSGDKSPPIIGLGASFLDVTDKALQTLYRVNVGGNDISPDQDTGMYRLWTRDFSYFLSFGFAPCDTKKKLKYTYIANYPAPDDVYRTSITMGNNRTYNNLRNITWKLPVDSRFYYLVRLHFCEFEDTYQKPEDRMFRIYLDNRTADPAFSVIVWTGGNAIPMYRDFVVNIWDGAFLFVDLHTRAEDSTYEDVILNGIEVFKMSDSDRNLAGPNPPLQDSKGSDQTLNPNTENSKSKKTLLAIALGWRCWLCCSTVYGVLCSFLEATEGETLPRFVQKKIQQVDEDFIGRLPEQVCRCFSLAEIKMATNHFDQALVIGRGGFGYVYKGNLADEASTVVAIKRLNKGLSRQGENEFEAEITMLSQLRHVHLVSLIGYCDDDDEMILVYDYMANGTLRDHLYGTDNDPLPWKQRLEHYLHSEVKNAVIRRDVKTTNILLDEKWVAKVADFGLSKLGRGDSAVSTAVKGTFGYMDPEYAQSRQLTDKSDVYSFGVVLFEVLCARKPVDIKLEEDQRNLAQWARKSIKEGRIQNIIDPYLIGKIAPECFKKFVEVAERCVRDYWSQRPTMHEVMENLEFVLELQEQADATQLGNNPDGLCSYPEKLSFHLVVDNRGFGYDVLGLRSGAGVTTTVGSNTAESGFPSLDSESGTRQIFSDASISKTQE